MATSLLHHKMQKPGFKAVYTTSILHQPILYTFTKQLTIASMKKLLLFIFLPLTVCSQNTIGLPDVTNYSKQQYGAGLQNWDIKQDKNGIIHTANNEGLLSFDGRKWNLSPLPNKTIVRSVEIGLDNKIYVGGQDELGYFAPAPNGELQYHSLTHLIAAKDKTFGDVWDIVSFNKGIFFRSTYKIFKFSNEAVTVYNAPNEWAFLGQCNGRLYAQDYSTGLMGFENDVWVPLVLKNELKLNDPITGILTIQKYSALITTLKNGIYIFDNAGILKLQSANNALFENERIYAATTVNDGWVALATNNSGVYIIDTKGNIIQSFSGKEGLQNNNVLSIFLDRQSNLWLGLDNGIDMIAYNSAIKQINPVLQNGSGYTTIIYNNKLFAGTSNGLYSVALQPMKDLSFSKGFFLPVTNAKAQTWSLAEINHQLLLGNHEGAFTIKDNTAIPISETPGFWNFLPATNSLPSAEILAGNYKGLFFFNYSNEQFTPSVQVPGFTESSRFIAMDKYGHIWVSHPYHGVYKLIKNSNGLYTTVIYTNKNGLPSVLNNHIYKIKNEVVIATEKGVFIYNEVKDIFEPSPLYNKLLGNQSIRYLKEDASGNIWFIHEKTLGIIDFSGKEPSVIYLPELSNKMLSGFEFIYPVDNNNIFLGGEKGFFHINYEKYKSTQPLLQLQIRTVRIINKTDSLLFGGYFKEGNEKQIQDGIAEIDNSWKIIRFEYASSIFGYQSNLEYSYRLKGFDENWSSWATRTEKEYTNLPAGNFTFEVKVRSNLGNESAVAGYTFTMLPPWYKTIWANIFYLLLLGAGLFALSKWQKKKFKKQITKYEEDQQKLLYIHELEINKTESEIVALRNENLEAEINFKNSELASSAMHLVKKGELLTKIKAELTHVMKGFDNPQAIAEVKKMIKTLGEDDNIDKEWESFTKHFDKVHSDFIAGLKEKHPAISGNELKLCAYLRMNLSTKEIAQLMNISVRGVEISRYRLRKKLGIASETNLFDYLIGINKIL
jgi:ligand-binding sensor domain-containing protein/DNA-binding CsgD family transcriptional regulator